jgi:hypothetical protein
LALIQGEHLKQMYLQWIENGCFHNYIFFSGAKIRISEQKNKFYLSFFEREYLRAKLSSLISSNTEGQERCVKKHGCGRMSRYFVYNYAVLIEHSRRKK